MRSLRAALVCCLLGASALAHADEGMWTFDNFPVQQVEERYGFRAEPSWLDHLRLSSLRIANGCSASFVSPQGLVLTNHHCIHRCVEQLSTAERDLVQSGYLAKTQEEELQCPDTELNQLLEITDVTEQVRNATRGLEGGDFAAARRRTIANIEKACATSNELRCDVVSLYDGASFKLYKYRRYQDVRLVFAPEFDIGFFGGDPDNFTFPRYNLDAAFLRAWTRDPKGVAVPVQSEHYLRWSAEGAQPGELVFTSGHPGSTHRSFTVAQLETQRDIALPRRIFYLSELRGLLSEFQHRGAEQRRVANGLLFGVENSLKVLFGRREALVGPSLVEGKRREEQELRNWVAADPERQARWGDAWDEIAKAEKRARELHDEAVFIEGVRSYGFQGTLFQHARTLVRAATERQKPNDQRLRGYGDANLPALEQRVLSPAPIHAEFEEALLAFSLRKMRETLGVDHEFVRATLGTDSPEQRAKAVVQGSRLFDPEERARLWKGGAKAIAASDDPMIVWVRQLDPMMREVRQRYEEEVDGPLQKHTARIAEARFAAYGDSVYPDATFTLRISYGTVRGWEEGGRTIHPVTTVAGLYERATGNEPYRLSPSWIEAKDRLDLSTPMNFVSDNDIIGGNSGSPVVNRNGEVVGLIFDGNLASLGGDYHFDPEVNRAVSVHSQVILEALDKVYGAEHILEELEQKVVRHGE